MTTLSVETIREFVLAAHFDLEKVKDMLAAQPELLMAVYDWGESGLEDGLGAAAHMGNRAIAQFFLSQGAPLTICVAAMLGNLDEVRVMLEKEPALANARGAHGITLMFHAAMSGNLELVALLKQAGGTEGYSAALHGAIHHRHTTMVEWLLENGAVALDVQNFQGKTSLQRAEETEQPVIADLLRRYGATM